MEKRLILAIALSVFIVLGFQFLTPKPVTPPVQEAAKPVQAQAAKASVIEEETLPALNEELIQLETENYFVTFSNIGGAIKKVQLKKYKTAKLDTNLELVDLTNPKEYLLNISSNNIPVLDKTAYSMQRSGDFVTYTATVNGIQIIKKYNLYKSKYGIELQTTIRNNSSSPIEFGYRIVGGSSITETNDQDKRFVEVTSDVNGKMLGFKKPKPGERIVNPGIVSWTALKNKYFSLILKPYATTASQFYTEDSKGMLTMGVDMENVTIPANSFVNNKFLLYAGPSSIPLLKAVDPSLESTVNYGFFGVISKAMILILGLFHNITRSWGFSVILLAIFLNLITFPLTAKSFKSMQKMQELHPQMELLKKQHKDNPQKLNKEIMELYKTYKINPLSGCLPILLQMPIFIALYQALMKCIELRNSSFFWIKDLSSPDAVMLPFTLPLIGNSINILPLIMIGAMFVQQKMSTKTMGSAVTPEQKEQQKIMLIIMPVVFGFIFYSMPSGLVLYWVVNTLLTITEQAAMAKNAA